MISGEILALNFMLGLLATFSPCLFPLLPSYVAITVRSNNNNRTIFMSSLFLILGLMIVFFTLGILFEISADFISRFLLKNYATFARTQAVLLVLAGLLMIKTPGFLMKIQLPQRFEKLIYDEETQKNPYLFSFLIGLVYTIIAAPCASGIFIFVWIKLLEYTLLEQLVLVIAFSLGAGFPFVLMSVYVPRFKANFIENIHNARSKLTAILGIVLIIVGIWLFTTETPSTFVNT